MIEVSATEREVRAVDSAKSSIEVTADDWSLIAEGDSLPRPTDATVTGAASALHFPPVFIVAQQVDGDATYELGSDVGPIELPPAEYIVRVDGNVLTYVHFTGAATLAKPGYEHAVLSFSQPLTVTLGFRSRVQSPPETITVPGTPEGFATALSYLPAGHRTATPDRSFPTMRGHPPLVELAEETHVPDVVADRREASDVELVLPPSFEYLFPAASLSHYLGAQVSTDLAATPTLRTPSRTYDLSPLPTFQLKCASVLRQVFMLDCLVRNAGPYGTDLTESRHLDTLELDADALYDASIATRVGAYLDAPFDDVEGELPGWHLSMYVDPVVRNVETLPYLLHNVPNVFLPASEPLSGNERLTRSLDDFYRRRDSAVSVDLVKPELGPGRVHGWLAQDTPIDVFKVVPSAYPNRFDYLQRAGESISVVAVLNDNDMADEHAEAARIYRQRATELDIDISVHEHLTTRELAEVFETPNDLVHYIGHCEASGLRCSDGNLSMSSLSESNAQTFFLNACGSFNEGVELVRQGSVAGAVTFNKVLDSHAARVGTTFARLLMNGFSIERALRLSRRRIMMGKDYTVVGDGTHVLTQSENYVPATAELTRLGDDSFELTFELFSESAHGGYYQPYLPNNEQSHLIGNATEHHLDRETLNTFLRMADTPVVYNGDIHWSEELADELVE